ncbi:MAG TPA: SCO family protein [Thermoleophilaceae bacterium]|jgi:protein SCO1/2
MRPRTAIAVMIATAAAFAALIVAGERARDRSSDGGSGAQEQQASRFEGALMPPGVRAPDFALRDERGRPVSMSQFRGRPVAVTFLYTTCEDTCPAQAQQIKGALDQLDRPVPSLAIAVDPPRDTPAKAREFLDKYDLAGRMRWVLGSRDQLRPLWRGFAIQEQTPDVEHQARIVLVDGDGFQRIGFPADQATPERLAHDLRELGAG